MKTRSKTCLSKNRRRLLLLVAAIFAFFCAVYVTSGDTYAKTYKIKTAADWSSISKKSGGTFKVTKDIKLSSTKQYLTITKNKKYTIDLNGHKVSTTYSGAEMRNYCPLIISKGTVVMKDTSKKKTGVLYSTETMGVDVRGKAKFYLTSGMVYNDAVEFRSGVPSGILLGDHAVGYIQGSAKVYSVNTGIMMKDYSKLYLTGHPYIRAGVLKGDVQFTHYGSGINVQSPSCTLSLKGGTIGTKANSDTSLSSVTGTYNYLTSGDYPVYDKNGKSLKKAAGYKFVTMKGEDVAITSEIETMLPGMSAAFAAITGSTGALRLATTQKDNEGYYAVYVVRDPSTAPVMKTQSVKVKKKTFTLKAAKLRKKGTAIKAAKVKKGNKAKTGIKYSLVKVKKASAKKYFKVASSGKITVKKKLKKGTYKLTIKATAAQTEYYKKASRTFVVTIKVK